MAAPALGALLLLLLLLLGAVAVGGRAAPGGGGGDRPASVPALLRLYFCLSIPTSVHLFLSPSTPPLIRPYFCPSLPPSIPTPVCLSLPWSIHPSLPLSIRPYICPSLPPSIPPSVRLTLPLSVPTSIHPFLGTPIPTPVCLSLSWSIRPSFSPSVPTSVHPYLHPSLSQHIHRYPSLSVSPLIHPSLPWSVCPYIPTSLHPCPCLSVRPYLGPSIPQVSMQYNPGWNGSSVSSVNVLHVRAVGRGDSLHYVWSSIGAPSVLLVATSSPSSALSIDWSRLLSPAPAGAVWIEPPGSVVHAAAVVFTKLFEYSKADASEAVFYPSYDLSDFSWDSINRTVNHTALTAELRGVPNSDPGGSFSNGSLAFRVTAYGSGGRDGAPPGLLHTANSSKVEFVLAGAAPRGNGSRFVLEVTTVQERGAASRLRSARSIDDEYTPTIFE
ncbi:glycosylated lysosomal membrane protein, partial [Centrocercus urophasianus]|uniref:glycosylated lysosomal membrane protein n=1 Tax=Centrocercus urophasianus TaxID=9002 RepID=UPI001C6495DD